MQIRTTSGVTIERLDHAIAVTAYCMTRHNLPELLPTLKRLQTERDNLIRDGDPIEYARRVLEHGAISLEQRKPLVA
jgi:hypothetical protein